MASRSPSRGWAGAGGGAGGSGCGADKRCDTSGIMTAAAATRLRPCTACCPVAPPRRQAAGWAVDSQPGARTARGDAGCRPAAVSRPLVKNVSWDCCWWAVSRESGPIAPECGPDRARIGQKFGPHVVLFVGRGILVGGLLQLRMARQLSCCNPERCRAKDCLRPSSKPSGRRGDRGH
jgi:hypothetical protein